MKERIKTLRWNIRNYINKLKMDMMYIRWMIEDFINGR